MKNILLLTDFSENSINALRYALQLFDGKKYHFFLLNVQSSSSFVTDDLIAAGNKSIYDSIVTTTKDELEVLIQKLKTEFKIESIEPIVDYDVLTDAISQIIVVKAIDLVVMGTNGVTGASEVLFGSNTINVIRKVDCPTLVIPKGFTYRKPNEILLPLDLSDALSGNAFNQVVNFTRTYGKKLHFLRIKPNDEDCLEENNDKKNIEAALNDLDNEYHIIKDIPMAHAVDSYIQSHQIDLTTLLVQNETLFERFFMGSPTTKISHNLRVPLLVFHS